jgi:hypothetical protein
MRGSTLALVTTLLFAVGGCSADKVAHNEARVRPNPCDTPILEAQRVSIVSLIAGPDRYEGKAVVVTGFYKAAFEHSAIYLHEDDAKYSIKPNGFWLEGRIPDHMQNRYVTVQGIFTTTTGGHLDGWPGTLCGASALG